MKDWQKYLLALAAVVVILAVPFIINGQAGFGGSDDAGSRAVVAQQPRYVRWVMPLWTPPPETESMLFALQAALGAGLIGYFIGCEKTRRELGKKEEENDEEKAESAKK